MKALTLRKEKKPHTTPAQLTSILLPDLNLKEVLRAVTNDIYIGQQQINLSRIAPHSALSCNLGWARPVAFVASLWSLHSAPRVLKHIANEAPLVCHVEEWGHSASRIHRNLLAFVLVVNAPLHLPFKVFKVLADRNVVSPGHQQLFCRPRTSPRRREKKSFFLSRKFKSLRRDFNLTLFDYSGLIEVNWLFWFELRWKKNLDSKN